MQVTLSFPGADFLLGDLGQQFTILDADGQLLASSGLEMAQAVRQWLKADWLDGSEEAGLWSQSLPSFACRQQAARRLKSTHAVVMRPCTSVNVL